MTDPTNDSSTPIADTLRILWALIILVALGIGFVPKVIAAVRIVDIRSSTVETWAVIQTRPVAALSGGVESREDTEGSGWTVLGSGKYTQHSSRGDVSLVRYLEVAEDGGVQIKQLDAEQVTIHEIETGDARIETLTCTLVAPDAGDHAYLVKRNAVKSCGTRYMLHVPAGTLTQDFSVSLDR